MTRPTCRAIRRNGLACSRSAAGTERRGGTDTPLCHTHHAELRRNGWVKIRVWISKAKGWGAVVVGVNGEVLAA